MNKLDKLQHLFDDLEQDLHELRELETDYKIVKAFRKMIVKTRFN